MDITQLTGILSDIEPTLSAFTGPVRTKILAQLLAASTWISRDELAMRTGVGYMTLGFHLGVMVEGGLVRRDRVGMKTIYKVNYQVFDAMLGFVSTMTEHELAMREEVGDDDRRTVQEEETAGEEGQAS